MGSAQELHGREKFYLFNAWVADDAYVYGGLSHSNLSKKEMILCYWASTEQVKNRLF